MSLFLNEVHKGRLGQNKGLKGGLPRFDKATNNIQKKMIYVVGADSKAGKSAFVNSRFVIEPFLQHMDLVKAGKIKWIYFSYEIDRVEAMAKFTAHFLLKECNLRVDTNYILGRGDNILTQEHADCVKTVYDKYIVPLFGVYDKNGRKVQEGAIDFIEQKDNPTGIRNHLFRHAENNGELIFEKYVDNNGVTKKKIAGYNENDPELYTIVIIDHVELLKKERGYTTKENIDKLSEYGVELRNLFKFTFVFISQFNRGMNKIDRLKFSGNELQPTKEDFKNTSNLAEDANMIIALFNPGNYPHLNAHKGYSLPNFKIKNHYRSIHVLASRASIAPITVSVFFDGRMGQFIELPKVDNAAEIKKMQEWINNLN